MSLPEIQISIRLFAILKILFMVAVFTTVAFNVLSTVSALPPAAENNTNTEYEFVHCYDKATGGMFNYPEGTERNSSTEEECPYPENYYNGTGYPNELIDDDLNESDEEEDEKQHADESKEEER